MIKKTLPIVLLGVSGLVHAQQGQPAPMLVEVNDVKTEMVSEQIWVPGTVMSRTDSNIASEVAGRLAWVAEVGDVIKKGEVLARIDDRLIALEHKQNVADIVKWEARVELLQRKQTRLSKMVALNNSSKDEYDESVSELLIARQELAQAELNKAQSEYRLAQTQVRSPFTALVVERIQNLGEFTSAGQDVIRIVDTDNVEASIRAPLSVVPYLKQGLKVAVKDKRIEKQETIRAVVPVGNAVSRMMEVRVALEPGDFPIGGAVRVALPHSDYHQATTVPRDALVLRKEGAFIYQISANDEAVKVPVTTGVGKGSRIEVMGDIDLNGQVVIRGAERLRAGQKVRMDSQVAVAKLDDI